MTQSYRKWELTQWLSDLENRNKQEIQLGLARISEVAERLALRAPRCPVITVAGTNGKGSTVTALEYLYHAAGYKVGVYTSPHLLRFNERIRVGLECISDIELCQAFRVIEDARGAINLTYFEMTTLAALWHFSNSGLDLMVLEVGLGGRLDATNIIDTDLAIITTIDFDHQDFLGHTLNEIGYEKAGILRPDKPFIYADINPPETILDRAEQLAAPSYYFARDYHVTEYSDGWDFEYADIQFNQLVKPKIQLKSAAAALMSTVVLASKLPMNVQTISDALARLFIPGRLQLEPGVVNILYDVSHNPQSVHLLAEKLALMTQSDIKIHAVFSALVDKDILGLLTPLKQYIDHWYPAVLDVKRATSAKLLLSYFQKAEINVEICYNDPLSAFETALNQACPGDLVVVYGSFFTVSQVMARRYK